MAKKKRTYASPELEKILKQQRNRIRNVLYRERKKGKLSRNVRPEDVIGKVPNYITYDYIEYLKQFTRRTYRDFYDIHDDDDSDDYEFYYEDESNYEDLETVLPQIVNDRDLFLKSVRGRIASSRHAQVANVLTGFLDNVLADISYQYDLDTEEEVWQKYAELMSATTAQKLMDYLDIMDDPSDQEHIYQIGVHIATLLNCNVAISSAEQDEIFNASVVDGADASAARYYASSKHGKRYKEEG